MAQPGAGQPNPWVSLLPFALMILIFYVLVLMPMRRRQKKIETFQSSLKVGDKVITTSGIYGQITKVSEKSVQVQIADRVRIEVARAGIGGYQGQDPVVDQESGRM
ncbi:MAG: preprotein translocase subunit YajC [Vicinamibacterales bacterium]